MKQTMPRLFVFALILAFIVSFLPAQAQYAFAAPDLRPSYSVSIGSLGSTYSQNFDSLANIGTSSPWTNDVSLPGWYLGTDANPTVTSYLVGIGSGTTGGFYSFGSTLSTDRALGGLGSNSYYGASGSGKGYIGLILQNQTGATFTSLDISYTGEQWRNGGNATVQSLTFSYIISASIPTLTAPGTAFSALDFASPTHTTTSGALDGNLAANRTGLSSTITGIVIPDGWYIMLRWIDLNDSGNDHGLAIDDLSVTPQGGVTTNPSGGGTANPNLVLAGNASLFTVAVTPGTFPTSSGLTVSCDLTAIGGSAAQTFVDDGTNGDTVGGDNTFSYSATIDSDTAGGVKSLPCMIADAQTRSGSTNIGLTVLVIIPIGTVNGPVADGDNGALHVSPYVGSPVAIQGVIYELTLQAISGTTDTYKGFYIQNTTATADTDPNTSDGMFVFMNKYPDLIGGYVPNVGDEVVIIGYVSEYFNMTELSSAILAKPVIRSGVNLEGEVHAIVANPPVSLADANRYWERRQGMRVQVPTGSVVLGGRNVFSPADAEVWVASPESTIGLRTDLYKNRAFRDAHPLDDNYSATNWDGNGYRILMGSLGIKAAAGDAQVLIDPARTFDTVTNAPVGGVNYTFSKYRIEITDQPVFSEGVDPAANNPPQTFDPSISYTIADYNLENLYDYRDNPFSGCDFAGNTGCPKVAPFLAAINPPYDYVPASDAVYQARLNDIALQIIDDLHSPDILMVQEVENQDICTVTLGALDCGSTDNRDGIPDVLQELAINIASLGGPSYDAAFDRNSSDLRGIAPAFLYRTDRVELLPAAGDPILGGSPAIDGYTAVPYDSDVSNPKTLNAVLPAGISACETSWVFPRAPSIALFRVYSTSIGEGSHRDVYVINNHFKSGPDTCVGHRTEQAKYLAALVAYIQAANPTARIVVGGDLNVYPRPDDIAYGASDQLGSLYDPSLGLKNLWEVLLVQAPESAYSYVYLGMAQTLDQMFVNGPILADLKQFRIAHINSDFAADYPGDVARGTSDHDPNVATFVINDPPTVNAGGPYTVNEGSSVTLTATGTDPESQPLTYAWDLDNNGTFETPGQSVSFIGLDGPATLTVNVQVTDNGGLTAMASATVTVNNVAPTVNGPIVSPEPSTEGSGVIASATFTDPGVNDAPFTCIVNYGDGSGDLPGTVTGNTCTGPEIVYPTFGSYNVTISVTDKDNGTGSNSMVHTVIFNWTGFFDPVSNMPTLNLAKGGSAVPLKFSLGGNKGLGIFEIGYPMSAPINCTSGVVTGTLEPIVSPGGSGLMYDPLNDQYTIVWKTQKAWVGTCRQLIVKLIDGTSHYANFQFK